MSLHVRTPDGDFPSALAGDEAASRRTTATPRLLDAATDAAADSSAPVLNREELLNRIGHDRELLEMLYESLREDGVRQAAELVRSLESADCGTAKRVAHAIKGTVGNMAGAAAFGWAHRVELAAAEGDVATARQGAQQLETASNSTVGRVISIGQMA